MSKLKICIDAGHCDIYCGARYGTQYEEVDNLRLALKVQAVLEQWGHTVYMTRTTGDPVDSASSNADLNARPTYANSVGADYFISIHRNASADATANGTEVWVYSKADTGTKNVAQCIQNRCVAVGGRDRGLKTGYVTDSTLDYAVNRMSTMPSCLLELLFVSNADDNSMFESKLDEYAVAVATGICEGMGGDIGEVEEVEEPTTEPTEPTTDTLYRVQVGAFKVRENADAMLELIKASGFDGFIFIEGK